MGEGIANWAHLNWTGYRTRFAIYFSGKDCIILNQDFKVIAIIDKINNLYPLTTPESIKPKSGQEFSWKPGSKGLDALQVALQEYERSENASIRGYNPLEPPLPLMTEKQLQHERLGHPSHDAPPDDSLGPCNGCCRVKFAKRPFRGH